MRIALEVMVCYLVAGWRYHENKMVFEAPEERLHHSSGYKVAKDIKL